jgi:hypothetical protein
MEKVNSTKIIVRTFVNVAMCPQYNNNIITKRGERLIKGSGEGVDYRKGTLKNRILLHRLAHIYNHITA